MLVYVHSTIPRIFLLNMKYCMGEMKKQDKKIRKQLSQCQFPKSNTLEVRQYLVLSLPGKLSETRNFPSPRILTPSSAQYDTKSPDLTTYIKSTPVTRQLVKSIVKVKPQMAKSHEQVQHKHPIPHLILLKYLCTQNLNVKSKHNEIITPPPPGAGSHHSHLGNEKFLLRLQ